MPDQTPPTPEVAATPALDVSNPAYCPTCNESRTVDDVCQNCHLCFYLAHCDCWQCGNCSRSYTTNANACTSCSRCSDCCSCVVCPQCNTRTNASYIDRRCHNCENCCQCGEDNGYISFFQGPKPVVFNEAKKNEFKINPSKRFISVEIEVAGVNQSSNDVTSPVIRKWKGAIVHDGSLPAGGFEINTGPANGDQFVSQIGEICEALKKQKGRANNQCGLHVHVDARDYNWHDIRKLAYLYQKIEDGLYSIISPSRKTSQYCQPCGNKLANNLEKSVFPKENKQALLQNVYGNKDANVQSLRHDKYHGSRYNALNLHSWVYRGSVECRMHHGTVNQEKITNWGMIWASIMDYAFDNNEREIKALKGDPISILVSIMPTETLKTYIAERYKYFKELGSKTNTED